MLFFVSIRTHFVIKRRASKTLDLKTLASAEKIDRDGREWKPHYLGNIGNNLASLT